MRRDQIAQMLGLAVGLALSMPVAGASEQPDDQPLEITIDGDDLIIDLRD